MNASGLLSTFVLCAILQDGHGDFGESPEWTAMRRHVVQERVRERYLQGEETSILAGLRGLDRALSEQRKKAAQIVDRMRRLESEVDVAEAAFQDRENEASRLKERVAGRAAAMLRLRKTRIGDLFREGESRARVRRARDDLACVLAYDARVMSDLSRASGVARAHRDELERRRNELGHAQAALATESGATESLREERTALLEAVQSEHRAARRLADEMLEAAHRLELELGILRGVQPAPDPVPGGFLAQRGRLPWPTSGRVEVTFGKTVDPQSGMATAHKGIDLRAPISSPVRAIFPGTVLYSAWFDGFGRMLILDHGDGFYSLYAHLESMEVDKGQSVAGQQVIGQVGDSESTKGAYVYFEIRHGAEAVDPMAWLTRD